MSVKKIKKLLVVALKPEWSHLKQSFRFQRDDMIKTLYHIEGQAGSALLQVGNGVENAGRHFSGFLKGFSCESVLQFGSCGSLDVDLKAGNLFVSRGTVFASDANQLATTIEIKSWHLPTLLRFLQQSHLPFGTGLLMTSSAVLKNRDEKQSAANKYQARAVDMESYAIARICLENAIDYLSVRGVFDTLDDDISALGEPYTAHGDLRAGKMVVNLVRSPKLILQVPGLQRRMGVVNRRLGEVIDWYLDL